MPENQTQPNNTNYANPSGEPRIDPDKAPEERSFDPGRPSDTEAVHQPDGAHAVRGRRLTEGERQAEPGKPAGVMDHQDPRRQDELDASEGEDETDLGEGDVGTTYEPSTVEVNRARQQGDGVGQKDLDYQRDPTGDKSYEEY